jgi:DivIVA domain-containing protein
MPLTPADVHNVTFSKPPIGKRGYNENEVDTFLDLVGAELARLIKENNDLHSRVDQLIQQLRATRTDPGCNSPLAPPQSVIPTVSPTIREQTSPSGNHHSQAARVLGLAQEIADRLTRDAKADADQLLSQARATATQLCFEAQTKSDSIIKEAKTQAQSVLQDAHARAETLERQSREKTAALEHEAARKHTETLSAITQEKNILEKKINELHIFEQEYRSRLKAYLNLQLSELTSRAPTATSGSRIQDDNRYIIAS